MGVRQEVDDGGSCAVRVVWDFVKRVDLLAEGWYNPVSEGRGDVETSVSTLRQGGRMSAREGFLDGERGFCEGVFCRVCLSLCFPRGGGDFGCITT